MKSISDEDGYIQISTHPGAYEIESLNNVIKRNIIVEEHFTEANYSFTMKPNFSTLGSIIEISPQGPIISFMFEVSIRDLLGFIARTICEKYTPSSPSVKILSFENIFLQCDIAQGMIF